jgi:hypothetical protein
MMMKARFLPGAGLVALTLAGSCSLLVETEQTQCSKEKPCKDLNSDYPLECIAGLCVQQEGLECVTSEACTDETKPVCNGETKKCQRAATCTEDPQCEKVYGLKNSICEGELCARAICITDQDCIDNKNDYGEGFVCSGFRCIDPVWGCAGQDDNREPGKEDDSDAVFKMQVLYALSETDLPLPPTFNVKVCSPSDTLCSPPVASYQGEDSDTIEYNEKTGWLTVRKLRNGLRYSIQVEGAVNPTTGAELLNGEFNMHRTIQGETVEDRPMLMFESFLRDTFAAQSGKAIDGPNTGLLFARLFDCNDTQLAGVTLDTNAGGVCPTSMPGLTCETDTFYFNADNKPETGLNQTTPSGRGGMVNLVADTLNTISCSRFATGEKYADLQIKPQKNWVSYINFYPRNF